MPFVFEPEVIEKLDVSFPVSSTILNLLSWITQWHLTEIIGCWKTTDEANDIIPGGGTAVTALQTAQHTEVAPTG